MKKGVYKQLNLTHLEAALPQVLQTAQREQWTYETFLERALTAELEGREQKAMARRPKAARIPSKKTLDGFDFSFQPTLSERRLRELADLSFVRTCTNLVFLGPPGTGKTHLSLALADRALTSGYSVLFTTLADLAQTLESASHPGLLRQRLRRYIAPSLLVIDEVGYTKLSQEQAHHFFELVAARYEHGSIILTSNTSFAQWGNLHCTIEDPAHPGFRYHIRECWLSSTQPPSLPISPTPNAGICLRLTALDKMVQRLLTTPYFRRINDDEPTDHPIEASDPDTRGTPVHLGSPSRDLPRAAPAAPFLPGTRKSRRD